MKQLESALEGDDDGAQSDFSSDSYYDSEDDDDAYDSEEDKDDKDVKEEKKDNEMMDGVEETK